MRYTDYPGFTKPYVIVHNEGFGTMEHNYQEIKPVAEADTWHEAVKISNSLKAENNPDEHVKSNWCFNTYHINVNTLHPYGKELLEEFHKEADRLSQHVKDNPDLYVTHKIGEYTFNMRKMGELD